MTTPTPDEQALTEQIAEAMCPRHNHLYFWQYETLTYCGECLARARAVLPVVKAAQREAWRRCQSEATLQWLYGSAYADFTNPYEETTP